MPVTMRLHQDGAEYTMDQIVPTADDVAEAGSTLQGWVRHTPVLESEHLNARVGARVLVKAECLQHGGSFKVRGALNRILKLSSKQREAGVVAPSSGNHGYAVALAAHWLQMPALIVMPRDAPAIKRRNVERLGAEVVVYERHRDDRERIAAELARERGAALVPPFDHADVIAGQGTVGMELALAASERKLSLDAVFVPCSGGGLVAGCALAIKAEFPDCAIFAVEPEGYDDLARSLASGRRQVNAAAAASLCDALLAATPGAIAFAINKRLLAGAVTVTDQEVLDAMALVAEEYKLIVEPSGAAGLAAALREPTHDCIGVVLSGANVDAALLARAVSATVHSNESVPERQNPP